MRTMFSGRARVHYGQIYVQSDDFTSDLGASFAGQQNGLCGAAVPGSLFLITGLHTGEVGFAVELHDAEPPLDDRWQEVVEASFTPAGDRTDLVGWAGEWSSPLDLERIDYRVRSCGSGMDRAHQEDTIVDGEPLDTYLLQFWPAAPGPDRVVKVTSDMAAYWHRYARKQPPPPTPEERAEAERLAAAEREREAAASRLAFETRQWGGVLPSEAVRALGWTGQRLSEIDRPLLDAIDRLGGSEQRAVAYWATRRAYAEAGLDRTEWIVEALAAMDRGDQLPEIFQGNEAFDRMYADELVPKSLITTVDRRTDNFLQQSMALPAIRSAVAEDPLEAAVHTVWVAISTFGYGREADFRAELRAAFPALR